MSIHVTTATGNGSSFPTATAWHVDDRGYLHITQESGGIATFHAASWESVERVEDAAAVSESKDSGDGKESEIGAKV